MNVRHTWFWSAMALMRSISWYSSTCRHKHNVNIRRLLPPSSLPRSLVFSIENKKEMVWSSSTSSAFHFLVNQHHYVTLYNILRTNFIRKSRKYLTISRTLTFADVLPRLQRSRDNLNVWHNHCQCFWHFSRLVPQNSSTLEMKYT